MIGSIYVVRSARAHALRPYRPDVEPIDGDATALVRPYVAEQERVALESAVPCWVGDEPVRAAS